MHEVRLKRRPQGMHPGFLRQQIALPRVTATARRQHVGPSVGAAARQRYQVISCQALSVPQLVLAAPAELAAVVVTSEEEGVGDLTAEATRHVNELDETDNGRPGDLEALAAHYGTVRLDDLRLAVNDEAQRPAYGHHRQRLEDRKSTRLNSSHRCISYAVFCLKKKNSTTLPLDLQYGYRIT